MRSAVIGEFQEPYGEMVWRTFTRPDAPRSGAHRACAGAPTDKFPARYRAPASHPQLESRVTWLSVQFSNAPAYRQDLRSGAYKAGRFDSGHPGPRPPGPAARGPTFFPPKFLA